MSEPNPHGGRGRDRTIAAAVIGATATLVAAVITVMFTTRQSEPSAQSTPDGGAATVTASQIATGDGGNTPAADQGLAALEGKPVTFVSANGWAMDLYDGRTGEGTRIQAAKPNEGNRNQHWILRQREAGAWSVETFFKGGMVADVIVAEGGVVNGGNDDWKVQLASYQGQDDQLWRFEPDGDGGYRVRGMLNMSRFPDGGCLTAKEESGQIFTADCTGEPGQRWTVAPG
ncbi:RICIN domain-containing protein [Spongiactinospora sp. TRM90649]|uniref:RICIN domain-containing protein n=1 Tax=Spongiactinospora sp. TRM90649 TaxID=3031114 RepID=UPI0023FA0A53|nr:RICIN domain-containing protein [Spongiactinospora sp. TRM90649]MDF5758895.1 ricin-type beta-trefoil lectin domain protein [Spongiactinospora sp. TRM90649]